MKKRFVYIIDEQDIREHTPAGLLWLFHVALGKLLNFYPSYRIDDVAEESNLQMFYEGANKFFGLRTIITLKPKEAA